MKMSLEEIEKKVEMTADKLFALGKKVAGFIGTAIIANKTIGQAIAEAKEITRLYEFVNSVDSMIEDVNALNNTITSLGGDKAVAEANVNSLFSSIQGAVKDANSETAKSFKSLGALGVPH